MVAFIKSLKYLDFAMVTQEEVVAAKEGGVPLEELKAIEGPDAELAASVLAEKQRSESVAELKTKGLHAAVVLFDEIMAADPESKQFDLIPSIM